MTDEEVINKYLERIEADQDKIKYECELSKAVRSILAMKSGNYIESRVVEENHVVSQLIIHNGPVDL